MFDSNDPRWTAYILNELNPADSAECEALLSADPDAGRAVAELRSTIDQLTTELQREPCPTLTTAQRAVISAPQRGVAAGITPAESVSPAATQRPWLVRHAWKLATLAASLLFIESMFLHAMPGILRWEQPTPADQPNTTAANAEIAQLSAELNRERLIPEHLKPESFQAEIAQLRMERDRALAAKQAALKLAYSSGSFTLSSNYAPTCGWDGAFADVPTRSSLSSLIGNGEKTESPVGDFAVDAQGATKISAIDNFSPMTDFPVSSGCSVVHWYCAPEDRVPNSLKCFSGCSTFLSVRSVNVGSELEPFAEQYGNTEPYLTRSATGNLWISPFEAESRYRLGLAFSKAHVVVDPSATREICYSVCKPVWETKTRDICYTVCKPTYETQTGDNRIAFHGPGYGSSTVTVSGGNTYTGATTISSGTLSLSSSANSATALTKTGGGTLNLTGSGQYVGNLTGTGSTTVASGGTLTADNPNLGTLNVNGTSNLIAGAAISGTGNLTGNQIVQSALTIGSSGAATVTINATAPNQTLSNGTLQIGTGVLATRPSEDDSTFDRSVPFADNGPLTYSNAEDWQRISSAKGSDEGFRRQPDPRSTARYDFVQDNKFLPAADMPLSTFAADVDTASYSNMRRFILREHRLPPKAAVRIEEFVNYFHYDMPRQRTMHRRMKRRSPCIRKSQAARGIRSIGWSRSASRDGRWRRKRGR